MSTVTDLESYQQYAEAQQAANNAWSAQQAQAQMDFQERMSNTAHQREVADLKAAGLNPILSVNSGASVPNGSQADTDTSAAGNVGAILQQVLSAQSAREVAGMYNAATIAAATIAANASMYGSDMSYWNTEDHPNTLESAAARMIYQSVNGSHAPGSGNGNNQNNSSGSNVSGNSVFSGLGSIISSIAQNGLGSDVKDRISQNSYSNTPSSALLAAGILGDKNAAKAYGARKAEERSFNSFQSQVSKTLSGRYSAFSKWLTPSQYKQLYNVFTSKGSDAFKRELTSLYNQYYYRNRGSSKYPSGRKPRVQIFSGGTW